MSTRQARSDGRPQAADLLDKLHHRGEGAVALAPTTDPGRPLHEPPAAPVLRPRILVALPLTVVVVALSLAARDLTAGRWSQVVLTAAVLVWCARPLAGPAWATLRHLRPNPDVPVLLAALVSWGHSVVEVIRGTPDTWFGTAAVVTTLLLLARHLESRALEDSGPEAPTPPAVRHLTPWFAPAVTAAALIALVAWLVTDHPLSRSLAVAVAVLVIASYPAIALASPAAFALARRQASQRREAAPDPAALATAAQVDTVVINRTGVLTTGELSLKKIEVTGRLSKKAALTAAAAVGQGSDHPVARAIVAGADLARIDLPRIGDYQANPGEGASARIKDTEVTIGKAALFEHVDASLRAHAERSPGRTVYVGWDGRARAALTVDGTVRDSSLAAVTRLKQLGLTPYLVSSGGEAHASNVAGLVGIDPGKVRAAAPHGQSDLVSELQRQGRHVAVLGRPRAGLLFDADDLDAAADTVELAQRTRVVTRQSLVWALSYDGLALVLGGLGVVHPALAGVLASLATGVVLASSRRLTR